jgi:two-component system OmpR family sensor kinase
MVVLELFFSAVFYSYISFSVDAELKESILKQGHYLLGAYDDLEKALKEKRDILQQTLNVQVRIAPRPHEDFRAEHVRIYVRNGHYYLEAYFPYEFALQRYLILTADVTKQKRIENKVVRGIMLINAFGMIGILIYAFILSGMLVAPIRVFSRKLIRMNEKALSPLDLTGMPEEFVPLGESINHLIGRIQSFINYKKELFVGTAHELKTPLAVIKTKSQVTLLKRNRSQKDLEEALRQTIRSVDAMNEIVSAILEFGRAEGAQFDEPEAIDVVAFVRQMGDEFALLCEQEHKILHIHCPPTGQTLVLPPLLLRQIIQNLLQNAIKFTPEGKKISLHCYRKEDRFFIVVRDEGPGIDENEDLFAPFKRSQDSSGAGLGLFLVKSAADALRAEVTLRNRRDKKGAVATLILPIDEHEFK